MTEDLKPEWWRPAPILPPMVPLALASEVATYLGVTTATLAKWRQAGTGPPYVRLGQVRYCWADVLAWQREMTQ